MNKYVLPIIGIIVGGCFSLSAAVVKENRALDKKVSVPSSGAPKIAPKKPMPPRVLPVVKNQPKKTVPDAAAPFKALRQAPVNKFIVKNTSHSSSKHCDCKGVITISQHDINKASKRSARGFVIDEAGSYKLCENVDWHAVYENSFAITIDSDDVTLDLGGFFMKQADTAIANNSAIQVSPSHENVKIFGGSLLQFSACGIVIQEGNACISVHDIDCHSCCYNGVITFPPVPPVGLTTASACIAAIGTEENPIEDLEITNCDFCHNGILDGVFTPNGNVSGIATLYASNIVLDDIVISNMYGEVFTAPVSAIFGSALSASNMKISHISSNVEAIAISLAFFTNSVIEDCEVNNIDLIIAANPIGYSGVRGAEGAKYTVVDDFILRRVSFEDISVVTEVPTVMTGSNSIVCCGFGCGGFADVTNNNGLVEDIKVVNLKNDGGSTPGNNARSSGVTLDNTRNVRFNNCQAIDISTEIGYAMGFGSKLITTNLSPNDNNVFTQCVAENIAISDNGVYAAGFILSATEEQVIGCTANQITGDAAYGIILDTFDNGSANMCVLANNTLTNCETAAIFDNTSTKNSVITGNYAALNGPSGAGPSYLNVNGFVPVVVWQPYLCSAAPATPSVLDNLDIRTGACP